MENDRNGRNHATPVYEKYTLAIEQAADYFGIGQKKIRQIVDDHPDANFVLRNGVKNHIKRRIFEQFINDTSSI